MLRGVIYKKSLVLRIFAHHHGASKRNIVKNEKLTSKDEFNQ
jgi:hypothetical protein